jgi:hypothetical protein
MFMSTVNYDVEQEYVKKNKKRQANKSAIYFSLLLVEEFPLVHSKSNASQERKMNLWAP